MMNSDSGNKYNNRRESWVSKFLEFVEAQLFVMAIPWI